LRRLGSDVVFSIPNLISLLRLPLAVVFLAVPDTLVRVAVLLAAGATDFLDGWWARTRGPRTRSGAIIDPVTDKVFVVAALAAFAVDGTISVLGLLVLLSRDVFVSLGFLVVVMLRSGMRLEARFPGKLVTNLQLAAVLVLLLLPGLATGIVLLTGAASVWAIIDYALAGIRALRARARQG
jgi:cardiolipin synthase (CMP-forming)